jgi:hypothetical protein
MNNLSRNAGGEMKDLGRIAGLCDVMDYRVADDNDLLAVRIHYHALPRLPRPVLHLHGVLLAHLVNWDGKSQLECDLQLVVFDRERERADVGAYIAELEEDNRRMRHTLKCMGAQGV